MGGMKMTRCSKTKRKMLMTAIAAAAMFSGGISGKVMAAEDVVAESGSAVEADSEAGGTGENDGQIISGTESADEATEDTDNSAGETETGDTEDTDSEVSEDQEEDADSDEDGDTAEANAGVATDVTVAGDVAADTETADTETADTESDKTSESSEDTTVSSAADPVTTEKAAEEPAGPLLVPETSDTDGWYQEGNDYYYYQNGKLVTNKVLEIKGQLYYFYSNGKMMKNNYSSLYNYEKGMYVYYRAKEDGKLYRNSWYQDEYGTWYHYGADGGSSYAIETVSGKKYLFDNVGALMVGKATYIDGVAYAGTNDGQPKKLKFEGWDQAGGEWFYMVAGRFKNDSLEKIDGDYYFFRGYGRMLKEGEFDTLYTSDVSGSSNYTMYHAKAGGKLSRNEWAYDEERKQWFYFGDTCGGYTGVHKIGGYTYVFDDYGALFRKKAFNWKDGYAYVADKDGHATRMPKNGWGKSGNRYYYLRDGEFVSGEVLTINGKLYGFSTYDYYMFANTSFSLPVKVDGKTIYYYYRAKADGSLYNNGWLSVSGRWYYYGSDGAALSGVKKLGSTWYAFSSSGELMKNTGTKDAEGNVWAVSDKGTAKMVPEKEWVSLEGKWYYCSDGALIKDKIVTIDGQKYYFDSYCALVKDRRINNFGKYSRAGKDGAFLTNQWYGYEYYNESGNAPSGFYDVNGRYYYFKDGLAQKSGIYYGKGALWKAGTNGVLTKITKDGLYYLTDTDNGFFITNGKLDQTRGWKQVNGYYYYVNSSGGIVQNTKYNPDGKYYLFNPDGTLIRNGWQYYSGYFYYATAGGALLTGDQKIGGKWYHFRETGEMDTGMVKIKDVWYKYGTDGVYIGKAAEGWNEIDGFWYYLDGGKPVTGEKKIGKDTYYFNDDGTMRTFYREDKSDGRIWGNDGKLVTGGWVTYNGEWFYVNPKTGYYARSTSEYEINGKRYCFDYYGVMQDYYYVNPYDREIVSSDSTGAITKKEKMTETWTAAGGEYYYEESDFTGWVGDYFVAYGRMMTGSQIDGKYFVGNDGKWIKKQGWYYVEPMNTGYGISGGYWIYIGADKAPVTDWQKIDGKWYYFSDFALITIPFISGDKLYLINEKGVLEQTVDSHKDGWYQAGDKWYYLQAGKLLSGTDFILDGNVYHVSYDRTMVTNKVDGYGYYGGSYYFDTSGKADRSVRGWKKVDGKWYFFGQNGMAKFQWIVSGSNTYYVDYSAGMLTGYNVIDGRLYQFGADGKLIGQVKYQNGWVAKGGYWFYFENGEAFYDDLRYINGSYYFFDEFGRMKKNTFVGETFSYAGSDGKFITNTWKKIDGDWYYFDKDGFAVYGWRKIGGKVYFFDGFGKMIQ